MLVYKNMNSLLFACLSMIISLVGAEPLPPIHWDSSNEIFRIDNTKHVFTARIRDTVEIHCPLYKDTVTQDQAEYSIIYMVSKRGYDNCVLDEEKPLGQCLSPYTPSVIRLAFREFTPIPNGFEFKAGEFYYFISTSNGSVAGLHNRHDGLCRNRNMRIKVEILPGDKLSDALLTPAASTVSPKFRVELTQNEKSPNSEVQTQKTEEQARQQVSGGGGVKFNEQNSKYWRLLNEEERRHVSENSLDSYEVDRPQSDERMVVKPLFLSFAQRGVTPKSHQVVTSQQQQIILYEIHETAEFDAQSIRSGASTMRITFWAIVASMLAARLKCC